MKIWAKGNAKKKWNAGVYGGRVPYNSAFRPGESNILSAAVLKQIFEWNSPEPLQGSFGIAGSRTKYSKNIQQIYQTYAELLLHIDPT